MRAYLKGKLRVRTQLFWRQEDAARSERKIRILFIRFVAAAHDELPVHLRRLKRRGLEFCPAAFITREKIPNIAIESKNDVLHFKNDRASRPRDDHRFFIKFQFVGGRRGEPHEGAYLDRYVVASLVVLRPVFQKDEIGSFVGYENGILTPPIVRIGKESIDVEILFDALLQFVFRDFAPGTRFGTDALNLRFVFPRLGKEV